MQILQVLSIANQVYCHCLPLSIASINILSVQLQSLIRLTIASKKSVYILRYYMSMSMYIYNFTVAR